MLTRLKRPNGPFTVTGNGQPNIDRIERRVVNQLLVGLANASQPVCLLKYAGPVHITRGDRDQLNTGHGCCGCDHRHRRDFCRTQKTESNQLRIGAH